MIRVVSVIATMVGTSVDPEIATSMRGGVARAIGGIELEQVTSTGMVMWCGRNETGRKEKSVSIISFFFF